MGVRILMIEDNEVNAYLARFLLERAGHEIVHATDGLLGLSEALRHLPALVLLDIQLPTMDGHAVAKALRAEPALRAVPIVAVTSYAMIGDRERALEAGCSGYIEKPIDPDTFVTTIESFLAFRGEGAP